MDRSYIKRSQYVVGKILQIEGDNRLGLSLNRSGHHMAIIRVGQHNARNKPLIAGDQGTWYMTIHQFTHSLDL
ncbi:hypothetical protein AN401_06000 [Zobellella denitrificans]|uniref:Transposase n=1 Tax=Zobellella denitrificans TaxID=347534 RepID=A0A291HMM0_9GAMM|nr:hypothetical protein AN401_06000 [Zobellella denitrificans]